MPSSVLHTTTLLRMRLLGELSTMPYLLVTYGQTRSTAPTAEAAPMTFSPPVIGSVLLSVSVMPLRLAASWMSGLPEALFANWTAPRKVQPPAPPVQPPVCTESPAVFTVYVACGAPGSARADCASALHSS